MISFLLKRPITVIMAFLACVIVGLVTYFTLPVSLLPAIAIPHITVQMSGDNTDARELENNITAPVRRQLLQVGGLHEIKSETRDGMAVIHLEFDYGVNTDLAFIEVDEKIDAAMNSLPKEAKRPKAIKASATDIPVLYLNMTLRDNQLDNTVVQNSAYIGVQDYLLDAGSELSPSEAEIYIKATDPRKIEQLQNKITRHIAEKYPKAIATFAPPENIFEKIFASDEASIEARVFSSEKGHTGNAGAILSLESEIENATGLASQGIPLRDRINIVIDREKLLVYRVDYSTVSRALRTALKSNKVSTLRSYQQYLPIGISGNIRPIEDILTNTLIATMPDQKGSVSEIPLSYLVRLVRDQDLKNISAGKNGEYVPLDYYAIDAPNAIIDKIKTTVDATPGWEVEFTGRIFSNAKIMHKMVIVLLISIMLIFFILCAQFESFVQPLIVLIEIPLDTAFALITLWIFGHTLNLMSAIGIIVTCGIVVNDSILKLDAINELRKQGMPLIEAIHTAGMRRFRPIIMTSLTAIFAMVPLLFTSDMDSELQRPLAIAMIGSMVVGTLISIFFIPLVYWLIYRKTTKNALR